MIITLHEGGNEPRQAEVLAVPAQWSYLVFAGLEYQVGSVRHYPVKPGEGEPRIEIVVSRVREES